MAERQHRRSTPTCLKHGVRIVKTEKGQILHFADWSRCQSDFEFRGTVYEYGSDEFDWDALKSRWK